MIIQPSNGDQFLNPIVQFRWQTLPKVDLYEKQISQNVSFSSAEVNTTSSISDIDTLLENGVYYYRIRGFNSDNQIYTDWNIGSFTMNYPGVPAARLISPIASDTINLVFTPLLLQWSGSTAASIDSVFVCNNSSCNNPLRRYGLNVNSISINDFSQNEFTTDKQQLFWKVISYDAFGKPTESTSVNSFYIKRVQ